MNPGESAAAVIGKSVEIRGEVKGNEDLVVDGHVEGTITLSDSRLTVGPNANVQANVAARDIMAPGNPDGKHHSHRKSRASSRKSAIGRHSCSPALY